MKDWDQDRLISASEVERWSYCPLSWLLEREDSAEDQAPLAKGIEDHERIGKDLNNIKKKEGFYGESKRITLAFLSFSALLVTMSLLLLLMTNVGFLKDTVWRLVVIISSMVLLMATMTAYIYKRSFSYPGTKEKIKGFIARMEEGGKVKGYFPMLSYFFGLVLLFNGIILLRPLGIAYDSVVTVFTLSLLFLYGALLSSMVILLSRLRRKGGKRELKLGIPLSILLLVSLSVLFILASDRIDEDGMFGWLFLVLSLLWFIGALLYDIFKKKPRTRMKKGTEDLPIATIALVASVFTAMAFLTKGNNLETYNALTILMAGLWLVGAIFFFIKGTTERRTVQKGKEDLKIPQDARIVQVDDLEKGRGGKPLVSKKHFLIGSPDILIEENGKKVPVEIKTGKVPTNPYFSHIMQLSAYLVLVDANYNQRSDYGYIEYAPRKGSRQRHKVEWDMVTKALVLSKVSEIRDAERNGIAHRNHNREGKCRSCSRRIGCPERLV